MFIAGHLRMLALLLLLILLMISNLVLALRLHWLLLLMLSKITNLRFALLSRLRLIVLRIMILFAWFLPFFDWNLSSLYWLRHSIDLLLKLARKVVEIIHVFTAKRRPASDRMR